MADTFIGGETSDISITLWFIISGLMGLIGLLIIYFLKIKDLKSIQIILNSISLFWAFFAFFKFFLLYEIFYVSFSVLIPIFINFVAIKNLKNEIISQLNKKGLTEKEIHLLQLLAGIKKK